MSKNKNKKTGSKPVNMPCDNYGMLACTVDCIQYYECHNPNTGTTGETNTADTNNTTNENNTKLIKNEKETNEMTNTNLIANENTDVNANTANTTATPNPNSVLTELIDMNALTGDTDNAENADGENKEEKTPVDYVDFSFVSKNNLFREQLKAHYFRQIQQVFESVDGKTQIEYFSELSTIENETHSDKVFGKTEHYNIKISDFIDLIQDVSTPDFQRNPHQWDDDKINTFNECVLNNKPIPAILLSRLIDIESEKVLYLLIDGLQRTTNICGYVDGMERKINRLISNGNESEGDKLQAILDTYYDREIQICLYTTNDIGDCADLFINYNNGAPMTLSQKKKPLLNPILQNAISETTKTLISRLDLSGKDADNTTNILLNAYITPENSSTSTAASFNQLTKLKEETIKTFDKNVFSDRVTTTIDILDSLNPTVKDNFSALPKLVTLFFISEIAIKNNNSEQIIEAINALDTKSNKISYSVSQLKAKKETKAKKVTLSALDVFTARQAGKKDTNNRIKFMLAYINDICKTSENNDKKEEDTAKKETASAILSALKNQ